jgi:membrane protease YdiL (CAAX protease family)
LPIHRSEFLILASLFQGGLAIAALGLAWLLHVNPFDEFDVSGRSIGMGIAGTIPMLMFFVMTYRSTRPRLRQIREFLVESLGPALSECRWHELVWVALLAGFSEELLFRAVLQNWLAPWGFAASLLISNLAFGFAHAVTPTYVVLAAGMGMYLGTLHEFADHRNWLVPMAAHTLYDLIAFLVIRRSYRSRPASVIKPEFDVPVPVTPD